MIVDALTESVNTIRKKVKSYPSSESSLVGKIFKAIKSGKTYDVFVSLDKANRIKKHLTHYVNYQYSSVEELEKVLREQEGSLQLFELLLIVHLISGANGEKQYDFNKFFAAPTSFEIEFPKPEISDKQFYINVVESIKTETQKIPLDEYAETLVIPAGPYKGRMYRHDRAPYNRQIHKWMSPESTCRELVNMWGVQIGKSTAVENAALYYMQVEPSEMLAVLATLDAAEKFSKKRIEPRASKAGVKFVAESFGDGKKRASGNKVLSKEFPGGNFDSVSAGSPSKLASETKRIVFFDEIDRYPLGGVGQEGDPVLVGMQRAAAWGDRAKIVKVSSPTLVHSSRIYQDYLKGTQHHFHVQCPLCDAKYPLEMGYGKSHGLTYETKAGRIDRNFVYYLCPQCKDAWFETDKLKSMQLGEWVPHATSLQDGLISTQLSSLYSPFKDWVKCVTEHHAQEEDPEQEQEFTNMTLGLPYEPKGTRPDIEKVITLRDQTYSSRTVPEGVLYLTAASDVQRGSKGEKKKQNPPRLEIEILGHCNAYVTKSIEYLVIKGETDVLGAGAWKKLDDLMRDGYFEYYRRRDDFSYQPMIWLFDSGDGERMDVVYQHCRSWGARVFPLKGFAEIKRDANGGIVDEKSRSDVQRYRKKNLGEDLTLYEISTNQYKRKVYRDINTTIARSSDTVEFAGRCYFPKNYPDRYFEMLTAEEQKPDGTFYCPSGRRNESLDIRVYNLAAADIWINMYIDSLRKKAKARGMKDLRSIDFNFASDILAKNTRQLWCEEDKK